MCPSRPTRRCKHSSPEDRSRLTSKQLHKPHTMPPHYQQNATLPKRMGGTSPSTYHDVIANYLCDSPNRPVDQRHEETTTE